MIPAGEAFQTLSIVSWQFLIPLFTILAGCRYDEHAWECTSCGYLLLTAHQLDLHVQEVHDYFFQAQAARSMKVRSLRRHRGNGMLSKVLNNVPTINVTIAVLEGVDLQRPNNWRGMLRYYVANVTEFPVSGV